MDFQNVQSTLSMNHLAKHYTYILIQPPNQNTSSPQNYSQQKFSFSITQKYPEIKSMSESFSHQHQISSQSHFHSQLSSNDPHIDNQNGQKKRMNKTQKLKEIQSRHLDDGRGGNCVASNICKTLLRVVLSHLMGQLREKFNYYIKNYQLRSQKENSVIIMLLLHVIAKQQKISLQIYEQIFNEFYSSLKQSQHNCQRKMKEQEQRKGFHLKNKRMYRLFAQINTDLFTRSRQNLTSNQVWDIKQLEEIVSNSYDRKQREVQKAMNKIKSIILNHNELQGFFNYSQIDIETVFFEAVDFAFRRNLPKRCRHLKERAKLIMTKFKSGNQLGSEQGKYMMCYMTLQLLDQKQRQIWRQFITNLQMKQQFNRTQLQRENFRLYLEKQIPSKFDRFFLIEHPRQRQGRGQQHHLEEGLDVNEQRTHKIEEETGDHDEISLLVQVYRELKKTLEF